MSTTTAHRSALAAAETARRLFAAKGGLEPGLWQEGTEDLDAAQRALYRRLRSALGPVRPPSRLVVLSEDGWGAAVHLAAAGYRVALRSPQASAESARGAARVAGVGLEVGEDSCFDGATATYDGVVLLDALPDAIAAGGLLPQLHRALLPGGRLVALQQLAAPPETFSEPAPWSEIELIALLLERSFCPLREDDLTLELTPTFDHLQQRAAALREPEGDSGRQGGGIAQRIDEWQQRARGLRSGEQRYLLVVARRDSFCVRCYRAGDERQILAVFPRLFHVERALDHWQWKYHSNPWGGPRLSMAFDQEGKLAAHYAAYPVPFYRDAAPEQELIGHQVGDTMTEPGVRSVGRGKTSLLARSARHFYNRYCEGRIAFNYGFNTGNIQKFALRYYAGARRVGDVPLMVRDLKRAPLPSPRRRSSLLHPYRVHPVKDLDASFDRLFEEVRRSYGFLAKRTASYLRWRYAQRPDSTYRIYAVFCRRRLAGWGVFRREGDRLRWGDALFHPRHLRAVEGLVARAAEDAELEGPPLQTVEGWFTPRPTWWRKALLDLRFEPAEDPDGLGMIYSTFLHDPGEAMADLYYTLGDGDLF